MAAAGFGLRPLRKSVGHTEQLPARVLLAFRLDVNEWKGERKVQFLVEGAQL